MNYCFQYFSFISTFISIYFSLSYSTCTINCLKVMTVQTLCSTYSSNCLKYLQFKLSYILIENDNYLSNQIDLIIIKVNYCSQCFSFISTFISIYFSLSYSTCTINCLKILTVQTVWSTYSSNVRKYLQFKLSYILIENDNYLSNHIDLIIIKVNYCSQCFSFISTFISIYFSLSYSTCTINCLEVLTVQTLCSTNSSKRLKYLQFKLSYILIENDNYLSNHIDLIIIKVNYCSQCFSFISTLISIYFSLSYSTCTINCLNVLTVQTLCSTNSSNSL